MPRFPPHNSFTAYSKELLKMGCICILSQSLYKPVEIIIIKIHYIREREMRQLQELHEIQILPCDRHRDFVTENSCQIREFTRSDSHIVTNNHRNRHGSAL